MSTQVIFARGVAGTGLHSFLSGEIFSIASGIPIPTPGTFRNLSIELTTAPGMGNSRTFTIQLDGVDTGLTVTISNTDTTGSIGGVDEAFAAGELFGFVQAVSGSPAASDVMAAIDFEPDTDRQSIYAGEGNATGTFPLVGVLSGGGWTNNAVLVAQSMPATGVASALHVKTTSSPSSGNSFTYSVEVNGTNQNGGGGTVDTRATIPNGSTVANASFSLPVTAGDLLNYRYSPTGGTGSDADNCALVFTPDSEGTTYGVGVSGNGNSTSVRYAKPRGYFGASDDFEASEADAEFIGGLTAVSFDRIYVQLDTSPSAGRSWTFTLRKNGADTGLTLTISDGSSSGSAMGSPVEIGPGDKWAIQITPSGSPNGTAQRISLGAGLAGAGGGGGGLLPRLMAEGLFTGGAGSL